MNLTIVEEILKIATITPQGRLDAFSVPEVRGQLDNLLSAGTYRLVVDLSKVSFLDSAGMALLVNVLKKARQEGGDVKLVRPSEEAALRILHLTKFDRVFELYETAQQAVRSF